MNPKPEEIILWFLVCYSEKERISKIPGG